MDNTLCVEQFLIEFFTANHCPIIHQDHGKIIVQLTIEMDKALMNRPFYWQYIEATGNVGEPKQITFITDPNQVDEGEWIHFGSPRLEQIDNYLSKTAKFIHLFQSLDVTTNMMLHPWLVTNFCIMYEGKQKKEELLSIGLNLINGMFILNMMEQLEPLTLAPTISNHCFTISPLIKPISGFIRIENYIDTYVSNQEHQWAVESIQLLKEEIAMIHHFYEENDAEKEKEKELAEVTARLQPQITYQVINGGIVYLTDSFGQ